VAVHLTRALAAVAAALALAGCSGPPPAPAGFNGCTDTSFVDGTAAPQIDFGGVGTSGVFDYQPRCLRIPRGQTVTFAGDFSVHPLSPGTSPEQLDAGTAGNPIPRFSTGTAPLAVKFPAAGEFPYFCEMHYAAGMAGVIRVKP
jgi:plastocyanin